jgi:hypothetical protein
VNLAGTGIAVPELTSLGNATQIEIESDTGVCIKGCHQCLPFNPMGLNPTQAVDLVNGEMGNLMGHRPGNIFFIVFGKYPGVVTDTAMPSHYLVHSCRAARQIKLHRDRGKFLTEY